MKKRVFLLALSIFSLSTTAFARDKITIENNDMFKQVVDVQDAKDQIVIDFADQYEDERVEFEAIISLIEKSEEDEDEYNVYVRSKRDGENYIGARFKLEVDPEDVFEKDTMPDYMKEGTKIHIIGDIEEYNEKIGGGIELDVIKIEEVEEVATEDTGSTSEASSEGMRPEIKQAIDKYEAWFNEYCELLEKFASNPTDLGLIAKYTEMALTADQMEDDWDALENSDLSDEEMNYYLQATLRIEQRLLAAESNML